MAAAERRGHVRRARIGQVPKIGSHVEPNEEQILNWHSHTARIKVAGMMIDHVDPDYLTRAWCTFYEIASGEPNRIPREAIGEHGVSTVHFVGRSCLR